MSIAPSSERLRIPETLGRKLDDFRRRVWTVKSIEAISTALFGVLAAFLAMFALDRFWDTPGWPRALLFALACLACAAIPIAVHRWIWRQRRTDQLARLLARKHPRIGDQLLGVIELAQDDSEQARSRRLIEAAIEQVAIDSQKYDFLGAVPTPRHRLWMGLAAVPILVSLGLFLTVPAAASNAWNRFVSPWKATSRYTFAALEPVPKRIVVAHGEPFHFSVNLARSTAWHPIQAVARIGGRVPVVANLRNGSYEFELPSQVARTRLEIRVGDASRLVEIEPMLRPELTSVLASVTLPKYLGRPGSEQKDARSGSITLVQGSIATFSATAGRDLSAAWFHGASTSVRGSTVTSPPITIDVAREIQFRWADRFGLAGKEPFTIKIAGRDDEAPTLMIEDLPRQKVVLDSELISFKIRAQDDFGIKRVGLTWQGLDDKIVRSVAIGDRILAAGGSDEETLDVAATFSAKSFGIDPQPIALRVFVEDFLPGRPRVVSPPYTLFVLSAEQHAIWLTEQLSKWHRQSLEVRDREMQLFEANKLLRSLELDQLDRPDTRKKIEAQASAERTNGRKLSGLVMSGEDLIKQAMRNPEFGVGHLERWAEMLQILKDISGNRMPSVADLLKQAAQSEQVVAMAHSNNAPAVGNLRSGVQTRPSQTAPGATRPPTSVPGVVDRESSQQPPDTKEQSPSPPSAPKTPRLLLPTTTLVGGVKPGEPSDPPVAQKIDEALTQQRDLLAEFEKVADELNRVLANLEGSTLVKRLKAASRDQNTVAGKLGEQIADSFGMTSASPIGADSTNIVTQINGVLEARDGRAHAIGGVKGQSIPEKTLEKSAAEPLSPSAQAFHSLAEQEARGSHVVSVIMDDLASYFERRKYVRFKTVLDEMRQKDVIGALRQLGDDLQRENGLSIAQAEYWSDTLDRWAEDLVDPTTSGACPGSKAKGSLPPSIVLEVLQILEGEVNLRDETRVAHQARPALLAEDISRQGKALSKTQDGLKERVVKVTQRIQELPDAKAEFGREIRLLTQVAGVMEDATVILGTLETGAPAIAAETEAIELLLQSRRINPKSGGGGGSSPGGGGRGTTTDSALALIGNGLNPKEIREDRGVSQSTGDSGPALPEEFRAGLDQYFNKLDRPPAGK